jgi:hypothetical protein
MKALLIATGLSAFAGSTMSAEDGLDKWVAAHEPQTATHHLSIQKDIPMRNTFMKAAVVAPLLYGSPHAVYAQMHAGHALREVDETQPQTSQVSARGRIDIAIYAYKEAVGEYVSLLHKATALEAATKKAQIKARLTGDIIKNSPEVQATYDAKDIAEAKMNAAETVMDAAIADIDNK